MYDEFTVPILGQVKDLTNIHKISIVCILGYYHQLLQIEVILAVAVLRCYIKCDEMTVVGPPVGSCSVTWSHAQVNVWLGLHVLKES